MLSLKSSRAGLRQVACSLEVFEKFGFHEKAGWCQALSTDVSPFRNPAGATRRNRDFWNGVDDARACRNKSLAPRHGFEPRFTAPKAAVLPLDDRGMLGELLTVVYQDSPRAP